jgi:hypothetical protein
VSFNSECPIDNLSRPQKLASSAGWVNSSGLCFLMPEISMVNETLGGEDRHSIPALIESKVF